METAPERHSGGEMEREPETRRWKRSLLEFYSVVETVKFEIYPLLSALQGMERSEQFDEIHKAKLFIQDILHLGGLETRNDVLAWLRLKGGGGRTISDGHPGDVDLLGVRARFDLQQVGAD